jgi:hypothetical protein
MPWKCLRTILYCYRNGPCVTIYICSIYATSRKVAGSIPDDVIGFFNWSNPTNRTMALWSTLPLTEMSTRNVLGSKGRPAPRGDNFTAICEPTDCLENAGASTSHNPMGLHGLLQGQLYVYFYRFLSMCVITMSSEALTYIVNLLRLRILPSIMNKQHLTGNSCTCLLVLLWCFRSSSGGIVSRMG